VADILPFRKRTLKDIHRGNTLCRNGHHKWEIDQAKQFDVREGKLVTRYRCSRCGKEKVKAH
tara:strand:+ start:152 stop:337 length:186 start_codon:yes stop_codon:yes gene_type:complete